MNRTTLIAITTLASLTACTGSGGGAGGAGGRGGGTPSGGAPSTGGTTSSGGAPTTGGTTSSGGIGAGGTGGVVDAALGGGPGTGGRTGNGSGGAGTNLASGGTAGARDGGPGDGPSGREDAVGIDGGTTSPRWSMGYYASWKASQYPIAEIAWPGLTHIAMAFYLPQANGSLNLASGDETMGPKLVAAAHANGVEAIASIGGSDSQPGFRQATASSTVAGFAANLVKLLDAGYDGIDIDWEPLDESDEPAVVDLAKRIRQARPGALLTIPIGAINVNLAPDLSGFAAIAAAYDQLNIMSYGQAGAWQGWKSWHSSALYHTDSATPISIDSTVARYLAAGVPAGKLGIGIGFYGLCYTSPVTGPAQALGGSTIAASDSTISYANIIKSYYRSDARKWDDLAKVPYLSFSSPQPPDGCTYISYDDEQSIAEKGAYVKANGLGGVIQWELNEGYLATAAVGQRNPLLDAIAANVLR